MLQEYVVVGRALAFPKSFDMHMVPAYQALSRLIPNRGWNTKIRSKSGVEEAFFLSLDLCATEIESRAQRAWIVNQKYNQICLCLHRNGWLAREMMDGAYCYEIFCVLPYFILKYTKCLKITPKVAFYNITIEASLTICFVYKMGRVLVTASCWMGELWQVKTKFKYLSSSNIFKK